MELVGNSPTKKKKRVCVFRDEWLQDENFKSWISKDRGDNPDPSKVHCKACVCSFSIRTDGVSAVKKHCEADKHKRAISSQRISGTLSKFFVETRLPDDDKVTAAEVALTYHGVQHQHSYLSQDCGNKLVAKVFVDSKISNKIRCGRTKSEAIVEGVLGPYSVQQVLHDLDQDKPFSLSTDASNKGNVKLYPVSVRYFCKKKGAVDRLLDFYDDHDETANGISTKLLSVLTENELSINSVVSYGADNASVNYGKHHSVFVLLKAAQTDNKLLKANCNCHVLHNAAKHACKQMKYDVETLVIKTYNEFSCSAKNVHELKECFEFVGEEYSALLRHVSIRWLSLEPAISRLIKCWKAVKTYFIAEGEKETPKLIWKFVKDQADELLPENELSLPECYLHFVQSFMGIFHLGIKSLEAEGTQVTEVYDIMEQVRSCLKSRIEDGFFGMTVNTCLPLLPVEKQRSFKTDALNVYQRAVDYLEKWFRYEDSPLKNCRILSLDNDFTFNELVKLISDLGIKIKNKVDDVTGDGLYNEYNLLKKVVPKLREIERVDKRWVEFFNNSDSPNLLQIVEKVMAIPVSNAHVERVFSLMKNLWTDERNRMRPELVKAELCVKENFNFSCMEFFEHVSKNKELLKAARSEKKYSFKK
jgi:hAT family C-terminal dimerisation region